MKLREHPSACRGRRRGGRLGPSGWALAAALAAASEYAGAADRALLVGIDRYQDPRVGETPGSEADARDVAGVLRTRFGFAESGIKLLLGPEATGDSIVQAFREWLIAGSAPGDRVFFHYSGHGSQLPDDDNDEVDGFDETLAPYDTLPDTGAHEIRDDTFGQLMTQLQGRRVVMLFDSCHSGTIARGGPGPSKHGARGGARYLPDPRQFKQLQQAVAAGQSYVAAGVQEKRGQGVSGSTFLGAGDLGAVTGSVVISAATPEQTVYPVEVGEDVRGALSYLFAELHRASAPSLAELREGLVARVKAMQSTRQLVGKQEPQTEVFSPVPLDDQPLFASWDVPSIFARANPESKLQVKLSPLGARTIYAVGEPLAYEVRVSAPGHLYLLVFSSDRSAGCLFPDGGEDGRVAAGATVVPRPGHAAFEAQEPLGRDVVVALLSARPLELDCNASHTWDTLLQRVGLPALRRAVTQGGSAAAANEPSFDWQAAAVAVETVAP